MRAAGVRPVGRSGEEELRVFEISGLRRGVVGGGSMEVSVVVLLRPAVGGGSKGESSHLVLGRGSRCGVLWVAPPVRLRDSRRESSRSRSESDWGCASSGCWVRSRVKSPVWLV